MSTTQHLPGYDPEDQNGPFLWQIIATKGHGHVVVWKWSHGPTPGTARANAEKLKPRGFKLCRSFQIPCVRNDCPPFLW